ncbi:hypothetical protein J2Z21_003121 [Streptomyces griseochromogenes]|uniref:Uncharacterized protein n=1 Tax=Streptomyces griseochromogenes TaxID=68214 RepID=A0A1B1AXA6_9ACTN|nr:hypothetical protein [Streptomyces griseochromogenes]ANP51150.1 hypothetical protein AVL59_17355 [Streptomyces griseochromogenes]MBP2050185.1 hypothetical protein [Streptomyces griseochromogenes]
MTEQSAPYISHPRVMVLGLCPGKPGEPPFRILEIDGQVVGSATSITDVLEAAASHGITIHDLDDPDMVRFVGGDKYTWTLH